MPYYRLVILNLLYSWYRGTNIVIATSGVTFIAIRAPCFSSLNLENGLKKTVGNAVEKIIY